jgi:hypothetical protein
LKKCQDNTKICIVKNFLKKKIKERFILTNESLRKD